MSDEDKASGGFQLQFKIQWEGDIAPREVPGIAIIDLCIRGSTLPERQPAGTVGVSLGIFDEDVKVANEWFDRTVKIFGKSYSQVVMDALAVLLTTASSRALIDLGISPFDIKAVLTDQLMLAEKAIRRQLNMGAGRLPMWGAAELSLAIAQAMQRIPTNEEITYDSVVATMREMIPERAPFSGESLRKMLKPLGISWKKLKTDAGRRKRKANRSRAKTEKRKDS